MTDMKIATFNINSINVRLPFLLEWLEKECVDILLLQEIKTEYNNFPFFEIEAAGYFAAVSGQKGYNGVAVLSKEPVKVLNENLPNFDSNEARYIEVLSKGTVFASVYMPNGNPLYSDKFDFKLKFMQAFNAHANCLLKNYEKVVIGGDFNVILNKNDVYDEKPFLNNALTNEDARRFLTSLKYLGYYDAFKITNSDLNGYTYWDYGPYAFYNDFGMRIDYIFCSALMAQNLKECHVDTFLRKTQRPSDHTPLVAVFDI